MKQLAQSILDKYRMMATVNPSLQIPVKTMLHLMDIAQGAMTTDYIICTNSSRSQTWIEVIPASCHTLGRFKDQDSLDEALRWLKDCGSNILGWETEAVGHKIYKKPDMSSNKDFYFMNLIDAQE